jgi:thioredoxin-like negative regulator of GroEL
MKSQLEAFANHRNDMRLQLIDIRNWDSPVAQQFAIDRLPTVWLFTNGRQITNETGATLAALQGL